MSVRAFWRRFGRLEHERLEFKRSANHLQESVVAMAMGSGGAILIGVSDDRRLVGCVYDQVTLDRISFVAHETGVDVRVQPLLVRGTPDGRILRRLGSANQPLRGDAVTRFVQTRVNATAA
jgi:ATP-dependent DNA helicase RecG